MNTNYEFQLKYTIKNILFFQLEYTIAIMK